MKKYLVVLLTLLIFIPNNLQALTKEDVLSYVENQSVCDSSSKGLLETYTLQLSRMLNERDLTENELNIIFNDIKETVSVFNSYGICKRSDLSKLPKDVKTNVKYKLYDVIDVISEAKPKYEEKTDNNSIVINDDKTVDVILDGAFTEKIDLSEKKFNYVGYDKTIIYILIILCIVFLLSLLLRFIFKKGKLKIFLNSLIIFSISIIIIFNVFSKPINKGLNLISKLNKQENLRERQIVVNDKKIERYPSINSKYGKLKINKLNIEEDITYGETSEILKKSLGHSTSSYFPGEGKYIIMSGHNYMLDLTNLGINDEIVIDTSYGKFTYKVSDIRIMLDTDYDEILINNKGETLILYTCYPFNYSVYQNKRFVVFSKLINEEWKVGQ